MAATAAQFQAITASKAGGRRMAVIDVGSNSIRLVVFDRLSRMPAVMYNEKVLCGLGADLARTGRLNASGIAQAVPNLARFAELSRAMDVDLVEAVATAAVREAADGADFVKRVKAKCGLALRVLSGAEEARLSALGVVAGIPGADGVIGDLGGGSLELVRIARGRAGDSATLALGPLRFAVAGDGDGEDDRRAIIDRAFAEVDWLDRLGDCPLYLVGGNWRALGRIHMGQADYPLRVIHHYVMGYSDALDLAGLVSRQSPVSLARISDLPAKRIAVLPAAAKVLECLLRRIGPRHLVFCASGLREGLVYAHLDAAERAADPLLTACRNFARRVARFPEHGEEIAAWMAPLLGDEDRGQARLRRAACLLSDIAWRVHPDYRAEYALMEVLWLQAAMDHGERVFLALAAMSRYSSRRVPPLARRVERLIEPAAADRARAVGLAARVAQTLSGGVPGVIGRFTLDRAGDRVILRHRPDDARMIGEVVRARLDALGRHLGLGAESGCLEMS